MSVVIPVIVTQSSINNGRVYIDAVHEPLLGGLRLGGRPKGDLGQPIAIEAGGQLYETDIRRYSSERLSPRPSFKQYLASVGATAGDPFRLVQTATHSFRLERVL